jgi:hypothetical protein
MFSILFSQLIPRNKTFEAERMHTIEKGTEENQDLFSQTKAAVPGNAQPCRCNVFRSDGQLFGDLFFTEQPNFKAKQTISAKIDVSGKRQTFRIRIGRIRRRSHNYILSWTANECPDHNSIKT